MDNNPDKITDISKSNNIEAHVLTHKSGSFRFCVGVDFSAIQPLMDRVNDAQKRFSSVPTLPDIATRLEKEVLVSSIYGTNTIEGGTLTEEETAALVSGDQEATEEKQRRVKNIKEAYEKAEGFAEIVVKSSGDKSVQLVELMFTDLHSIITRELTDDSNNIPGLYRDNLPGVITQVGSEKHGGAYRPPKNIADIKLLIGEFLKWINSDEVSNQSPLIRAPLVHYYFERIHPFWDGNGRVGRVLEALVLKSSKFKYAPFAMSKYYQEHIDEYFSAFNAARKSEERGDPFPNTCFVQFFLGGMLEVINKLHDRMNIMVALLLYESELTSCLQKKSINMRQYTIINNLMAHGVEYGLDDIRSKQWFRGLYLNRTERTQYRDLKKLAELKLIDISLDKKIKLKVQGF